MLYLLDSANLEAIEAASDLYPIAGVTTNPTLIAREGRPFRELVTAIRQIIGPQRQFHVQVVSPQAEGMLAEARHLAAMLGQNFYAKLPVTPQGIKAIRLIRGAGIAVTATAVFTVQQAVLAARAGAAYVAPYVNRLDEAQTDGAAVVAEMVRTLREHGLTTGVLAASFKNSQQVQRCCAGGTQAVTLAPALFASLLAHPLTEQAVAQFAQDWEGAYGVGRRVDDL